MNTRWFPPESRIVRCLLVMLLLALPSCGRNTSQPVADSDGVTNSESNTDATESLAVDPHSLLRLLPAGQTGIDFRNDIVETQETNILTYTYMYNGGGVAAGDINNDGLTDLFLTSNQGQNKLYLNLGGMKFRDISKAAGIDQSEYWHSGVTMADVNSDGWLDIYVCRSGDTKRASRRSNLLFINQGDLTFREQASQFGIADTGHSTQSSFFDYDHDGDLDLFVLNHPVFFNSVLVVDVLELIKEPAIAAANSDNLYRNNGDGTFSKVTLDSGCQNFGYGLGIVTADLNEDGWTDIYIANDFSTPDQMLINQKDGTFRDEIKQRTGHISYYGMGCDVFDFNNDSKPDIIEVDMTAQDRVRAKTLMPSMSPSQFHALVDDLGYAHQYMFNSLQLNQGDGQYSEIALMAGVAKTDWSWAVLGADLDLDGLDDLIITNGFKRDSKDNDFLARYRQAKRAAGGLKQLVAQRKILDWVQQIPSEKIANYAFRNHGQLGFEDKSNNWGFTQGSFSNGAAYADLDNDGDLDFVINNIDQNAFVYQNQASDQYAAHHYLQVQPVNAQSQPVFNARVQVTAGSEQRFKELTPVRGYQSSVEPILHFGLGAHEGPVSVVIDWPGGGQTRIDQVQANQRLQVSRSSHPMTTATPPKTSPYLEASRENLGLEFQHQENRFSEYRDEVLLPHSQSSLGPSLAVGDTNGDGMDDILVGGSKGQSAALFVQQANGSFVRSANQPWDLFADRENVDAVFVDVDQDNDLDLYLANGGGSDFEANSESLRDQLFLNEEGLFKHAPAALPDLRISTGSVCALDFDHDGDMDLFVGGRGVPGKYPTASPSYLLENKDGAFTPVPEAQFPRALGLINDSIATDFNQDGKMDLIAIGEWTPIQLLENRGEEFVLSQLTDQPIHGWWFSICEGDFNSDGRPDYVLGNLGQNNKFYSKSVLGDPKKVSRPKLKLFSNDFDDNATLDIVLSKQEDGIDYPLRGKECSTEQMPFLREKFPTYEEFALADLSDILGEDKLEASLTLSVNSFESCVLLSHEQGFQVKALPKMSQISPIRSSQVGDYDSDGNLDLICVGNLFDTEVETTRYDSGRGILLLGDGQGEFRSVFGQECGLNLNTDSRQIRTVETSQGTKLIVGSNNTRLLVFDLNQPAQQ